MTNLETRLQELALDAEGAPMSEHDEEVAAALRETADTLTAVRKELEETSRALVAAQNFVNDAAPNAMTLAAVWDRIEGAAWLTKYQREFFLEALDGTHDE